jgi:hypothetical protein
MAMKRTHNYLDEDISDRIHAVADAEGRSAAALIREAVVRYLAERGSAGAWDPFLDLAGAFGGGPADGAELHDRDLYGSEP